MKRFLTLLKTFLPHLTMALSFVLITLLVTDRFNRAMNFINNDITKGGLAALAVLVIVQSIMQIVRDRKER